MLTLETLRASSFAIIGLGSRPGEPDTPERQALRRDAAVALLRLHGFECVPTVGTYGGESEPGVLIRGPGSWSSALVVGRVLRQESVFAYTPDSGAWLAYTEDRWDVQLGTLAAGRGTEDHTAVCDEDVPLYFTTDDSDVTD